MARPDPILNVAWLVALLMSVDAGPSASGEDRAVRRFTFTYAGRVSGLTDGERVRAWLPVPKDDEDQRVVEVARSVPGEPRIDEEPKAHNRVMYFEAVAGASGTIPFSITYRVTRTEAVEEPRATDGDGEQYLGADTLVPIGGRPSAVILADRTLPADQYDAGRTLYDWVDDRMQYRKDRPGWGRGDAAWACDSRFGNCTDFHSLFISLARTLKIPAKFEIGFALPPKHGSGEVSGYHCWARFKPAGHGWVPVDISEANKDPAKRAYFFGHLCENRVAFTSGRDLDLVPKQDGPPLNFFVYPYAEAGGKPVPAERITRAFSFEDVEPQQEKR